VGPYWVQVSDGNSRKGITREEKHCKKFSQCIAFGRKKGYTKKVCLLLFFIQIESYDCVEGVPK
jgi:hypothetical protein